MRNFIESIEPARFEEKAVRSHKRSLRKALKPLDVGNVRLLGSFDRGTAIRDSSDADFFAIIPRKRVVRGKKWLDSNGTIAKVQRKLETAYGKTEMVRDGQALAVAFYDVRADVVPAIWVSTVSEKDGYPVYQIPNGHGGWMKTSPDALGRRIKEADERAQGRLKYVARALKSWRDQPLGRVPLRSLYSEMALVESGACEGVARPYAEMLRDVFRWMADRKLAPLEDPDGVSDAIVAATDDRLPAVQLAIANAAELADKAAEAERRGDEVEALRLWNEIFGGRLGQIERA